MKKLSLSKPVTRKDTEPWIGPFQPLKRWSDLTIDLRGCLQNRNIIQEDRSWDTYILSHKLRFLCLVPQAAGDCATLGTVWAYDISKPTATATHFLQQGTLTPTRPHLLTVPLPGGQAFTWVSPWGPFLCQPPTPSLCLGFHGSGIQPLWERWWKVQDSAKRPGLNSLIP